MKQEKGFTLIELLVVIAIIGVMAALVIVNLSSANKKSRDARRKADLSEVRTALELYYDDNLQYPTAATMVTWDTATPGVLSSLTTTYIKTMPQDPRDSGAMQYSYIGNASGYTLTAYLENYTSGITNKTYSVYSSN